MRKRTKGRKLSRKKDQRRALMRHLANSLVLVNSIVTTEAKAKELRPFVEKAVSKARRRTLAARRMLAKDFSPAALSVLFGDLVEKFASRPGGYTRITKLPLRESDGARMAKIEFIG